MEKFNKMTKTIKVFLLVLGFVVLVGTKFAFKSAGTEGGIIWALFLVGYLAYARAIWKYEKNDNNDK